MRWFGRALGGSAGRATASLAATALLSAFLAACASSGDSGSGGGFLKMLKTGGASGKPDEITQDFFAQSTYCPQILIRGGTEALPFYEKGHDGDPAYIKYQASLGKTARECHNSGSSYTIKIGVAGRVVAGPKGGPGTVTVPLRIAVAHQFGGALYSELFKIPVNLAAPDFAADFSHVVEQATVEIGPQDRDLLIFIGFDDGKPPKKPAENQPTG